MTPAAVKVQKDVREPGVALLREQVIASDFAETRRVLAEIEKTLHEHQFGERDIFCIRMALEEALVNAIKHGNQLDRARKVRVAYQVRADRFEAHVTDEGPGFDPLEVPDPTAPENLERPCGRGLMIMRHYMNEVSFTGRGNTVSMCKHRNGKHE